MAPLAGWPHRARFRRTARPAAVVVVLPSARPPAGQRRPGSATDLADAKAKFKAAWARIRSGLTEAEIAHARRVAEISAEAVARYDRKGRA
jgi:hypothetical protein